MTVYNHFLFGRDRLRPYLNTISQETNLFNILQMLCLDFIRFLVLQVKKSYVIRKNENLKNFRNCKCIQKNIHYLTSEHLSIKFYGCF